MWLKPWSATSNFFGALIRYLGNKRLKHSQIDLEPHIRIGESRIDRVKTTKSLGLMIDESLIWNAQVDRITGKVNSGLGILRRLRDIVDYQTLIVIYLSII